MTVLKTAIAASLIFVGSTAMTQDRNDWAFEFRNNSGYAVTQINTRRPDGSWSTNWLRSRIAAGARVNLEFYDANDTRCEVVTRVTFANDEYFEDSVDYCNKDVVIVTDDAMTAA